MNVEQFCEEHRELASEVVNAIIKRQPKAYCHKDDLLSEAMLKLVVLSECATVKQLQGRGLVRYICRSLNNVCIDYLSESGNPFSIPRGVGVKNQEFETFAINESDLVVEDFFEDFEMRDELLNGVCQNDLQRQIMTLRLEGKTFATIREELGITDSSLRKEFQSIRHHARVREVGVAK